MSDPNNVPAADTLTAARVWLAVYLAATTAPGYRDPVSLADRGLHEFHLRFPNAARGIERLSDVNPQPATW